MGQRLGGILNFTIDGTQYAVRGSFQVTPSSVKREGVAGQDYVHGYTETPIVPGFKGEFSTVPGLSLQAIEAVVDSTIIAQMANGTVYILTQAWTKSAFEIDSTEGKFGAEFQGITCEEDI